VTRPGGANRVAPLDRAELHGSLGDPVLTSIAFLNEIMSRFPDAISFAPGAPHLRFLRDLDVHRHVDRYVDHLCAERGLPPGQARRLLYEYGPSRGLITDLVSEALRDQGIDVPPEAVVITVGAQEAMVLTLRALCRSADEALAVVTPCFVGILGAARLLDIDVVGVGESGHGLDLEQLAAACRAARAGGRRIRAVYVAPDYANPSGTRLDLPTRLRLLDLAEQEDLFLLEDSAYWFTALPEAEIPMLKALDTAARVIHIGTFAKLCLPGARVGFAVADQFVRTKDGRYRRLADDLADLKTMLTVNTSPICQAIVGGMLLEHGGSMARLGREKAALYRRNLANLLSALEKQVPRDGEVSWNHPEGGFFVRMRLPIPADTALLELSASKYRVLWTPMSPFHLDAAGANELRLSCSYLDPEQIEEGVGRLAEFLRNIAT
jgi:(S)-3,5-dihydroxyphenylglycine transaminase